ncbi:MAG: hypothetical protein QY330_02665 [Candidatus Dojkabacteria bacterium]|uniref:TrbC/VIRB2 family protein n=2 Tax=Candidatus Dojkabacteria TaxID=74243 RepID=A0A136KJV6_9BACT|nr:MAG: hypothetical protein UZ20_WS6002000293 [candidate division WS6 bacterium OLB21]MBW7953775.1 hypothetical protein [Candidatus Dojkabacteria bacterium]WKZ28476.1 MAG: hypothetical protein QY330_02665 [Candidatus Dojkabacteria bacterium]
MKKQLSTFVLSIVIFFVAATKVLAQNPIQNPVNPAFGNISSIVSSLSAFILPAATLALLAMIILGGFTKLTAAGNADQEAKANKILTYAVIGFVIIIVAPVVVGLIGAIFGIQLIGN